MELKVWVEGIQRVVCGVNEKTTCQDVVYALAHATGKTGRFTLIERWRNNERLLAPGEQPLKVLLKWGELSNDVQFILQWSPLESSSSSKSNPSPSKCGGPPPQQTNLGGDALINDPFKGSSSASSSSYSPGSTNPGSNGVAKKLPYSSASQVSFSHPGQKSSPSLARGSNFPQPAYNGVAAAPSRVGNEQMSSSSIKGAPQRLIHNSDAIKEKMGGAPYHGQGNVKSKELSAPPPYREPPNPMNYQGKVSPSVSSPSLKGLPPYREPPPPTMTATQSPVQFPYQVRGQSSNSPVRGVSQSGSQSYFGSSANSSSSSLINANSNGGTSSSSVVSVTGGAQKETRNSGGPSHSSAPGHIEVPFVSFNNNASDKSDRFWASKDPAPVNGETGPSQNGSVSKPSVTPMDSPNSHYKELVRLVNSQREKLTSQQAELTQYDAEIMFWEGKAKEQQRNMEFITKEISRLELISSQNESQVLSLSHLEEESEYVRQESESLKSQLSSLRTDMTKCESELDKCKSRLRRLAEDLLQTQTAVSQRQEEWHVREAATLAEVDRLKLELDLARRETDAVSDLSGSLDKEVHSLESSLAEKKKQMEQLVSAMKEANLQSLIINPPDEQTDGGAHQRSGSTRRMIGSPRQLENAAPTSKNPHGVWV